MLRVAHTQKRDHGTNSLPLPRRAATFLEGASREYLQTLISQNPLITLLILLHRLKGRE